MHYVYCQAGGCLNSREGSSGYCEEHSPKQEPDTALDTQVGGSHYKDMKIQPVEYIHANNIPFLDGNVVKYISRHRNKNGAADVHKAIHYCQLILQLEYGEDE
jgi:hypothetical protein